MPNGAKKDCCGETQANPDKHWRRAHQQHAKFQSPSGNTDTILRNSTTGHFQCPGCDSGFEYARSFAKHTRKCSSLEDTADDSHPITAVSLQTSLSQPKPTLVFSYAKGTRRPEKLVPNQDVVDLTADETDDQAKGDDIRPNISGRFSAAKHSNHNPRLSTKTKPTSRVYYIGTPRSASYVRSTRKKSFISISSTKPTPDISSQKSRASTSKHVEVVDDTEATSLKGFLESLKRPCSHLLEAFEAFGIETVDELEVFYQSLATEGSQLEKYFPHITQFEWFLMRQGLDCRRKRAYQ